MKERFFHRLKIVAFVLSSLAGMGLLAFYLILAFNPFPQEALSKIGYSKVILDKDGNILRAFTGQDDSWMMPVELSEINPFFAKAVLSIEDKHFYQHPGVDVLDVVRALAQNITQGRVISGASTITMQTVRLLEKRKRSFFNKIIEAAHALYLERRLTKAEILKLYFEITPFGGNIHGIKAASLRYFQKNPKDLTLSECALLAGIPQSPSRLRPDRHPAFAQKRRDRVLASMFKDGAISKPQYTQALQEPVLVSNKPFPFEAPHFSEFVKKSSNQDGLIQTSLDINIQHYAEIALKTVLSDLKNSGVTNGSVVVIENATGKIRAFVGSNDFFSDEAEGQINGALARRSPGSALKPFTYALGIDRGFYTPSMILADVPVQHSGYAPINYDKQFRGPVTVRQALVNSLNVPAVEVLDRIGVQSLYSFLKDAGVSMAKPADHYGLALTLGAPEVKLFELTNAYAMLARMGVYKPVEFSETVENKPGRRLLSVGAAYIIADMLSDTERLEAQDIFRDEKLRPRIAWKTGTSYGHKDAWTFAYNPEYTIGVWLGNFSAKPTRSLMGVNAAAPLAFKIFDWLYTTKTVAWYEKPSEVEERKVCALSGEPIGTLCPHAKSDLFIKGKSEQKVCRVHQKFMIDKESGLALEEKPQEGRSHSERIFTVWPDAIVAWLKNNDAEYNPPPKFLKTAKRDVDLNKNKPQIVSPAPGCEYFASDPSKKSAVMMLAANASYDAGELFWFVDDKYIDTATSGQKLFWTTGPGKYKITCSDNFGRSSSVVIAIR